MVIKKNIPQLRFPEFKGGWEKKKLGDIMSNKSQKYNPKSNHESFKCIELEHLASETGHLIGYTDSQEAGSIKNRFEKGDVLFGKLRPYLRKYLLAPFTGVCSSEIWVLTGKKASNEFIYRLIQTNRFIGLANQSSGSKMPRADWDVISSSLFYFPTLPEQQKIASFFTAIDQKITQLKRKLTLLEQYKKGVMQLIFSQQIRFKDEVGQEFPKWEKKKLGEIATFFSGGTPLTTNKSYYYGDIPFIKSGEISSDKTEQFITSTGLKNSSAKLVKEGSILYALYGATSGEVAISKMNGAINQAVLCIQSKENHYFIYSYLKFKKEVIINTYLQGGQGNLSAEIVKSIEIVLPSLPEQTTIANFLSAIDDKINHTQTQIEKVEHWKKGLLQKMFV